MTRRLFSRPSAIVSPGRQFGTAALSVGGSAGVPSSCSSLNVKVIRFSFRFRLGTGGGGEGGAVRGGGSQTPIPSRRAGPERAYGQPKLSVSDPFGPRS